MFRLRGYEQASEVTTKCTTGLTPAVWTCVIDWQSMSGQSHTIQVIDKAIATLHSFSQL